MILQAQKNYSNSKKNRDILHIAQQEYNLKISKSMVFGILSKKLLFLVKSIQINSGNKFMS